MYVFFIRLLFIVLLIYLKENSYFKIINFDKWYIEIIVLGVIFVIGDYIITKYMVKK